MKVKKTKELKTIKIEKKVYDMLEKCKEETKYPMSILTEAILFKTLKHYNNQGMFDLVIDYSEEIKRI